MSDELESYLAVCRDTIERSAFMVNLCDAAPLPYAYTVGLTPMLDRELFVIGQDEEAARIILNEAALHLLEHGIPEDGTLIQTDRTTDLKLATVRVDMQVGAMFHIVPRLGYMPPCMLQVVVADAHGAFPDHVRYEGQPQALDCCVIRSPAQLH